MNITETKTNYKVIYIGGALDHTVLPIILKLHAKYDDDFLFVATKSLPQSRQELGYGTFNNSYNFVFEAYGSKDNIKHARTLIYNATIVLCGSITNRYLIRKRLFSAKITFLITERFYKEKTTILRFFRRLFGTVIHYHFFNKKNKYALCIGGYAPNDLDKAHLFKGKRLKWGYFTEYSSLSFEDLEKNKQNNFANISWVGRFVDVKQPFMMISLAHFLKLQGKRFKINMVGYGPLLDDFKRCVNENNLENEIIVHGALPLDKKEKVLNETNVFVFSSTQEEGWGAVVNESLGSGCLVVASKQSGAGSALIKHGVNGFLFDCFSQEELNNLMLDIVTNYHQLSYIRKNGYDLIHSLWNQGVAANRLCEIIQSLINSSHLFFYDDGPCSEAIAFK